jgi:ribulose-5-phosphate 4-epimerase/fuculose-1-phosphate aldolase
MVAVRSAGRKTSLLSDLVTAHHILHDQGVLDAFGHISVRDQRNSGRFWMSRSIAPAQVTRDDLLLFGLSGNPVDGSSRKLFLERFIHSEIYRARPDVMAVAHTHSPMLIVYSVSSTRLRPLSQVSGFLGTGAPVFDIRSVDKGGDMLIRTPELGKALARKLGQSALVLMRGHGSATVGDSIRQLVWRAIYAEVNAQQQIQAMLMGRVKYLSRQEARHAARTIPNDPDRAWELWKRNAVKRQW